MRGKCHIVLLIPILFFGCQHESTLRNSFTSLNDTLIVGTEKQLGAGVFSTSVRPLLTKDTSEVFNSTIIYPNGIKNIKRNERCVDLKTFMYHAYKKGQEELWEYLVNDIKNNRIDTSICPSQTENYINIIEGFLDGSRIIIVDENNNKDLTDDSVRVVSEIEWENLEHFIECNFPIYNGKEIVMEKSWLNFRTMEGSDQLFCSKFEHVIAEFDIDNKHFRIAVNNAGTSDFTYDQYSPTRLLFVLLDVEAEKYEYNKADYLLLGEVFRLYDEYYRIEDISHNGGELTLIKEHNFENRTGTQVGMKAPEFNCISVDGDTINSITLHDKGIIIVNMCGCGGDTESIEEYNKIKSRYGETFHIFGLDSQFDNETGGVLINTENPYNKEVYEIYRKNYCSRMTYVIGKNRKIRNKFSTKNWQGGIEQSENSP